MRHERWLDASIVALLIVMMAIGVMVLWQIPLMLWAIYAVMIALVAGIKYGLAMEKEKSDE